MFYFWDVLKLHDFKFKVEFLEEANDFLESLEDKERDKIIYNIWKASISNDKELFRKLKDEIWEFRTLYNRTHFRLFAFWDKTENTDTIVISTHGIIKKTNKQTVKQKKFFKKVIDSFLIRTGKSQEKAAKNKED